MQNNRASIWLSKALLKISEEKKANNELDSAFSYSEKSILIYKSWLSEYEKLSKEQIRSKLKGVYNKNNASFKNFDVEKIKIKRIDDIILAQKETLKRLSVAYTNIGIAQRHKLEFDDAIASYKKALKLWKGNLNAKNSINILLGRPIEDLTIFEKLFPEEREK